MTEKEIKDLLKNKETITDLNKAVFSLGKEDIKEIYDFIIVNYKGKNWELKKKLRFFIESYFVLISRVDLINNPLESHTNISNFVEEWNNLVSSNPNLSYEDVETLPYFKTIPKNEFMIMQNITILSRLINHDSKIHFVKDTLDRNNPYSK